MEVIVYMNKRCITITEAEYKDILNLCDREFTLNGITHYPKPKVKMALILEANLGIRISDICSLKLKDIVLDGNRYRLNIIEQKTQKKRTFTVPLTLYKYISNYCLQYDIPIDKNIVQVSIRQIQQHLKYIVEYLEYSPNISTHSFRKFFATNIYINNNYNVILVQQLLQHSSINTTQRYIGIGSKELEEALEKNLNLG